MPITSDCVVPPARPFRRDLPTLSPSKVADLDCPKKFAAKHITRTTPAESWSHALTYGSGLHKVFYQLYRPTSHIPVYERDIAAIARAAFAAQTYPPAEEYRREQDIARATQTVTRYLASDGDALNTVQAETDERTQAGNVKPITLFARFDRLIIRPDEPDILRIVDYKTGSFTAEMNPASATLTLAVAKLTLRERFPNRQPLLCYDFVNDDGLVHREEVSVERVRTSWKPLYESAFAVYHGGDRTAVHGPSCQFCPLSAECRPSHETSDAEIDTLFDA